MNKINSNIEPELYRDRFINDGSVIIRDFLIEEYVEELYSFFNSGMPNDWWYSTSFPGAQGSLRYIRNFEQNQSEIEFEKKYSEMIFNEGSYAYHFYRTAGDHFENCPCQECKLRGWLRSEEVVSFLSRLSGIEIKGFSTMFASKYSSGCFLGPHHDDTLGSIGFVLQLTKNWRPQWGGILHFTDDNRSIIEYSEVPTFNTLTLFHIPKGKGKWHYVSHVSPGISLNRIAYSGWYHD